MSVSKGAELPNRSIQRIDMKPAPRIGAGYWALNVQVANHAEEILDNVPIQVELDNRVLVNGFINGEANEVVDKTFYFSLGREQHGPAHRNGKEDALAIDDQLHFLAEPFLQSEFWH